MMKRQTVEQLLLVFQFFRERHARGKPLHKSYQEAVREVADRYAVTYQTIGDGCRRRLGLASIRDLYALLARWMEGDPEPLVKQLKGASDRSTHDDIATFFGSFTDVAGAMSGRDPIAPPEARFDTFSVRLAEREARMLRALAEIEGVSPPKMLSELGGSAVRERIRRVAQSILHDLEAPPRKHMKRGEVLRILRDNEAELRSLGIEHVSVFGSAAREDTGPSSDVDLAVRLAPGFSSGGFDYFGRFEALRARLAEILGCPVDLIEEPVEKVGLQEKIDEDRAVAF